MVQPIVAGEVREGVLMARDDHLDRVDHVRILVGQ
jgi:hypothetical protein